ncbi:MAG: hypothetical protein KZQ95_01950 [Candidatus Thiodiazotropha sp. (ex Epidulcina cf. delphinae)]|nr:hypothetical protein [Candidatus Thiodiazotropha sp. (ex Epidulcina cf. delphinae)]
MEDLTQPHAHNHVPSKTTGTDEVYPPVERLVINPMTSAPKDGTPVLLKFKSDLEGVGQRRWRGLLFVGSHKGDCWNWGFAAPVGQGGFPDDWMEGWYDITGL